MAGIYLHIPFCKQACSYCDFYFVTRTSEREHFVQRLQKEIKAYQDTKFSREPVETIYFGGGTPSLLEPKQAEQILDSLHNTFDLNTREITFEMNPDDASKEFLSDLYTLGINRISMGVQTFQPKVLKLMNRVHSREEAMQCLELLQKSQFDSFTVDLVYGNPGQSTEQIEEDLEKLLVFDPPHISAYSLIIEPNTHLGEQVKLGHIIPPEDDQVIEHFELINIRLREHGIERYEVSNYSRPGCEAIHNSKYWEHENYLGFGPAAHSFWWDENAIRWENEPHLRRYLRDKIEKPKEQLTLKQLAEERLMMGLRTTQGVALEELAERYNYTLSDQQQEYLYIRQKEDKLTFNSRIFLTDKGIKIADAIILDLVTLH